VCRHDTRRRSGVVGIRLGLIGLPRSFRSTSNAAIRPRWSSAHQPRARHSAATGTPRRPWCRPVAGVDPGVVGPRVEDAGLQVVDERGEVWTRFVSWHDRASVRRGVGASAAPRAAEHPHLPDAIADMANDWSQTCAVTLTVEITGTLRPLITGIEAYSGSGRRRRVRRPVAEPERSVHPREWLRLADDAAAVARRRRA